MDINPATRGHALVVPRRHAANLLEIEPEDLAATMRAAQRLARDARSGSAPTASTCSTRAAPPPGRRSSTSTST